MNANIINGFALIRGTVRYFFHLTRKSIRIKNLPMLFSGVYILTKTGGTIEIGRNFRAQRNAKLSSVNGGKLQIDDNVSIGENNIIKCQKSIKIGEGTIMGPNVMIFDQDHMFDAQGGVEKKYFSTEEIVIGKHCWIAANVVILKGTTIGDNCVVGAGCVIKGKYESNSLIVQKRETEVQKIQ